MIIDCVNETLLAICISILIKNFLTFEPTKVCEDERLTELLPALFDVSYAGLFLYCRAFCDFCKLGPGTVKSA